MISRVVLIDTANDAFIQGIHLASVISVIGAIGLAIFVAVFLRGVDAAVELEDRPDLVPRCRLRWGNRRRYPGWRCRRLLM